MDRMKPACGNGQELRARTFRFAARSIRVGEEWIRQGGMGRMLAHQFVRSATSIGANVEEGQGGQSRRDFTFKISIACKEARESHSWLRLIAEAQLLPATRIAELTREANELVAILTTIARKAKSPR